MQSKGPSDELTSLEKWFMDWAFKNSKPQAKFNYTLGQAVRAAWEASAESERHKFEALQRSLSEALNSGDGSYRP